MKLSTYFGYAGILIGFLSGAAVFAEENPAAQAADTPSVQVNEPWVREGPPAAKVHAGYLEIENTGAEELKLIGISSPDFKDAMLHDTEIDQQGVAHMKHLMSLSIAPGERVIFKKGGKHLMLFESKKPLQAGDTVQLELLFEGGKTYAFQSPVKKAEEMANH